MNTLEKYLFRQTLGPLCAVIAALAAVAILTQGLDKLSMIATNQSSGLAFAWVTILTLPQLISLILPLALFFAVAYSMNRMHSESETVVAYAAGVSYWAIARPIIRLAVACMLVHLAVVTLVQPASYREMRRTVYAVRADIASALVREGAFTFPAEGLTLYARERGPDGEMRDMLVHDDRPRRPLTYTARRGAVITLNGKPAVDMRDGQIQRQNADGGVEVLDFDQYTLQLGDFFDAPDEFYLKPSDRYLSELFKPDMTHFFDQTWANRLLAEGHYRLAAPLLNPALALIALAGLLGGDFSRRGYGQRLAAASVTALLVRLCALALQAASAENPILNPLQYALPIVVSLVAGWMLVTAHPKKPSRHWRDRDDLAPLPA